MWNRSFDSVKGISRRTFLAAAASTAVLTGIPGFVDAFASTQMPQPTAGKAVPVGDFSVVPLFDGPQSFDLNLFYGADEQTMLKIAGVQPIPSAFNAFLIKHGQERFLVDTGNGTLVSARTGQLPLCLQDAQTAPADISKIFITHLHGDHAGGLIKDGKPAFSNAKVYVAKAEYDYWQSDEAVSQAPERIRGLFLLIQNVLRILEQDKLIVFFTPGDLVAPDIISVDLAGHTPGHTGFMLTSKGKKLFFVGDLLHGAALQMPRPDITFVADTSQPKAKEIRLRMFKWLAEDKIPIAGAHLPFPGIGLVQSEGDGYKLKECT
ncbi:MAG: MBL fold metallo-hydrolase [Betaproteobacteria bacterium]|nr:MBL fold metallo-hydrolase [Betaproteobacteria bacterium]